MSRVLIVGAGLTGSLCACLLRRELPGRVHVEVWDKARGAGGRMSTSRAPDSSPSQSADLGAQYITTTAAYYTQHHNLYSELVSAGVLRPLDAVIEGLKMKNDSKDFVSPRGMSGVVKHFLAESGAKLFLERHVTGVYRRGASWEVERKEGDRETFDAVVLTMPVPQILQLQGDVTQLMSVQQRQLLDVVVYTSRFALALFFPPDVVLGIQWGARYVPNSSICYIANNDLRRNNEVPGLGPSLVVHTSVPFGLEHLEKDKEDVQPIIMKELYRLLPDLPQPISIKCHKWRYSQVLTAVPDSPGHMTLLSQPLLVIGGDAFCHSNFDGCVESALSMLSPLKAALT
ncbi:renalase [Gouania willdenowi]|uniref:Amine oxidase domain-containing protein n=1 Tax=Gouania willdenowi TaxID=441366 RepID=A0A8C5GUY7_GOUWI|nr:renalase [Gouania willdenowi]